MPFCRTNSLYFSYQVIRDFRLSFSQPDNQFLITVLVITAHISFPLYLPAFASRCLTISYARTPAATEAFRESISPFIGMDAVKSHASLYQTADTLLLHFRITSPHWSCQIKVIHSLTPISAQTNQMPFSLSSSIVLTIFVTLATGV